MFVLRHRKECERLSHDHNGWQCSEHRRGGKALTTAIFFKKTLWFLELFLDGNTVAFSTGFQRTTVIITLQQGGLTFHGNLGKQLKNV